MQRRKLLRRLLRNDHARDLVVGGLGNDLLLHQVGLGLVRTAVDDLLRIGSADAWKRVELVLGRSVDVERLDLCGSHRLWRGRGEHSKPVLRSFRLPDAERAEYDESARQNRSHYDRSIAVHIELAPLWKATGFLIDHSLLLYSRLSARPLRTCIFRSSSCHSTACLPCGTRPTRCSPTPGRCRMEGLFAWRARSHCSTRLTSTMWTSLQERSSTPSCCSKPALPQEPRRELPTSTKKPVRLSWPERRKNPTTRRWTSSSATSWRSSPHCPRWCSMRRFSKLMQTSKNPMPRRWMNQLRPSSISTSWRWRSKSPKRLKPTWSRRMRRLSRRPSSTSWSCPSKSPKLSKRRNRPTRLWSFSTSKYRTKLRSYRPTTQSTSSWWTSSTIRSCWNRRSCCHLQRPFSFSSSLWCCCPSWHRSTSRWPTSWTAPSPILPQSTQIPKPGLRTPVRLKRSAIASS